MGKCVKIEMDDAGGISVGLDPDYGKEGAEAAPAPGAAAAPPGADANNPFAPAAAAAPPGGAPGADDEAEDKSYMQPARNVDDALKQAKALLEEPTDASGQSPFEAGFAQARGQSGPPTGGMPGQGGV